MVVILVVGPVADLQRQPDHINHEVVLRHSIQIIREVDRIIRIGHAVERHNPIIHEATQLIQTDREAVQ